MSDRIPQDPQEQDTSHLGSLEEERRRSLNKRQTDDILDVVDRCILLQVS